MSTAELQLARVEGTRLAKNPAVWTALALTAWWAWWVRASREQIGSDALDVYWLLTGYGLVLPAFVMFAVGVMAVLRGHYARTEELFDTVPVGRDRRSVGHGISGLAGGGIGLLVMVALVVWFHPGAILGRTRSTLPTLVPLPRPNLAQVLQGPMAIVVICALGVALARWLPRWPAILALLFPFLTQFLLMGLWTGTGTKAWTWWWPLSTGLVTGSWVGCTDDVGPCDLRLAGVDQVTPWWHVAYLAALAVALVTIAVLRHRRDRVALAAFATSVVAVIALAAVQAAVHQPYVGTTP
jgi:hypothetical protein